MAPETAPHGETSMNDTDQTSGVPARSLDEVPPMPTMGNAPRRKVEPNRPPRSVGARMAVGNHIMGAVMGLRGHAVMGPLKHIKRLDVMTAIFTL